MMINEGLVIPHIELKKKVHSFFLMSFRGQAARKLQLTRILGESEVVQPGTALCGLTHPQRQYWSLQVVYPK